MNAVLKAHLILYVRDQKQSMDVADPKGPFFSGFRSTAPTLVLGKQLREA